MSADREALRRALYAAADAFVAALEEPQLESSRLAAPAAAAPARRRRRTVVVPPPDIPATDRDRALARRILRRRL